MWTDLKYERMMHQKKLAVATKAVRVCGGAKRKLMTCTGGQNMQPVCTNKQTQTILNKQHCITVWQNVLQNTPRRNRLIACFVSTNRTYVM